jgi:hypothetical protein
MKLHIIFLIFFLVGCETIKQSENSCHIQISLANPKKSDKVRKGYEHNIERFQYLLQNSIENMLYDLNTKHFPCQNNQSFILNISYQNDDIYGSIKQSKSLKKHSLFFYLKYSLKNVVDDKILLNGNIRSIDSFITPSHFYSDILSSEDAQISSITNLTQRLKLELMYYLQHTDNK